MRVNITAGRRLASIASLTLPVLIVALAKVAGLGPLSTRAEELEQSDEASLDAAAAAPAPPTVEPRLQLSAVETEAAARARELREHAAVSVSSPFYAPNVREPEPAPIEAPVVEPAPPALPSFALNGIMNGRPPIAVIDGQVHQVGDDLGEGWRIESIDARSLSVLLRHDDGREHQLRAGSM